MIPTVIIPVPAGGADNKTIEAVLIAFFIVGVLLWIAGYVYDGLKYKKWTYRNVGDNMGKFFGVLTMITIIVSVLLDKLIDFIKTLL